jgi:hypothetical protein
MIFETINKHFVVATMEICHEQLVYTLKEHIHQYVISSPLVTRFISEK